MTYPALHSFEVTLAEAKRIQEDLRSRVVTVDLVPGIRDARFIGGADVAFVTLGGEDAGPEGKPVHEGNPRFRMQTRFTHALAGIVVFDRERGVVTETACALAPVTMPYIPGYLSFREGPAMLKALEELSRPPEVIIYDGCGIAHPRGLGLASHLGVLTGIPSVGCAKNRLCGQCGVPGSARGSWTDIVFENAVVGSCVRTRTGVKPVFVSPGSGVGMESARNLVLGLAVKYRLPEPTRLAHQLVSRNKKVFG